MTIAQVSITAKNPKTKREEPITFGIRSGVSGTIARLRTEPGQRLVPAVELADYADIADVRRIEENQAVQHVRQVLDAPIFPIDIELRPGQHEGRGLR